MTAGTLLPLTLSSPTLTGLCSYIDVEGVPARLTKLFKLMSTVYDTGARNFLFVNIPPMELSPSGGSLLRHERLNRLTNMSI